MKLLPGSESFSNYTSKLLPGKAMTGLCGSEPAVPVLCTGTAAAPGWEQDWQGDGDSVGLPAAGSRSF